MVNPTRGIVDFDHDRSKKAMTAGNYHGISKKPDADFLQYPALTVMEPDAFETARPHIVGEYVKQAQGKGIRAE